MTINVSQAGLTKQAVKELTLIDDYLDYYRKAKKKLPISVTLRQISYERIVSSMTNLQAKRDKKVKNEEKKEIKDALIK